MEFEVLKDLVQIINKNKIKQIEVLGASGQKDNNVDRLYDALCSGKVTSDDEAAELVLNSYGKDPAYKKLRLKLIRQLMNTAFFIDMQQNMFSDIQRAFHNCYRDFAVASILTARGAPTSSSYILQQTLEQAIRYEFTELAAEIARQLRIRYARSKGDISAYEKMVAIHRQYEEKRRLEMVAFENYDSAMQHYITGRSTHKEIYENLSSCYEELLAQVSSVNTYQYYFYTYSIGVVCYWSVNNTTKALQICNEALNTFLHRETTKQIGILSFASHKLTCLTQLRKFDDGEGEEAIQLSLAHCDEGNGNWFKLMSEIFYYRIYAKQYESALEVFVKATRHPRFHLITGMTAELWHIYKGYLHLLAILGKLKQGDVTKACGDFKIPKFVNNFNILDKEKDGMNIPIIMLPVLFSVVQDRYQDYVKSAEALDKYRQRYLQNTKNLRSASFMKLMFALSDRKYNPDSAERRIKNELEIIKSQTPFVAGQTFAVEIVPYEDLWEYIEAYVK